MIIKGLDFRQTCCCSPEQYDVFDEKGTQVGYVRLRWGGLRCDYPDCGGEEIYYANVGLGNDCCGCFHNESERKRYLTQIADKILEKIDVARCGMNADDRKEAIKRITSCLDDGYVDFSGWMDCDELSIIREAMELLIEREEI